MAEKFNFQKEQYIDFARQMAKKYDLPEDLFLGQLEQESQWNPKATSRTGAKGIGQFQEQWHPVGTWKFKTKEDYFDPKKSIESAAMYMSSLKNQYNGNYMAALAHYNGGTKQGKLVASGQSPDVGETANYIPLIQEKASKYAPKQVQLPAQDPALAFSGLAEYFNKPQEQPQSIPAEFIKEQPAQIQQTNPYAQDTPLQVEELRKALIERDLMTQQTNMDAMKHQEMLNSQVEEQKRLQGLQNMSDIIQGMSRPSPYSIPNLQYQIPENYTPKFQMPQNNPWN